MTPDSNHPLATARQPDWLDQMIEKAREKGEFDDLPGRGEPLKLAPESAAPSEYDLAFTMLSNAGYAPYFMEIGKEVEKLEAALATFRDNASAEIGVLLREAEASAAIEPSPERRSWWTRLWRGSGPDRDATPPITRAAVRRRREELARQHADRAAQLDTKTAEYHAALPRELWYAQRARRTPADWAMLFDSAVPAVEFDESELNPAVTP